jgi:Mg2+ and Co2+ transporter CorA
MERLRKIVSLVLVVMAVFGCFYAVNSAIDAVPGNEKDVAGYLLLLACIALAGGAAIVWPFGKKARNSA